MAINLYIQLGGATATVLAVGMLLPPAATAAPHRPPMTGQQLVRDMLADPREGYNSIRRERAMGYMDGVMDATAGTTWCPAGRDVPHELNYLVVEGMARLSADQLKGDAMSLVADGLRRAYPCEAKP